jgi:SAM-dependent methyltransferase
MTQLSRQYNKLCDLPDFDDPALRAMLRDIVAPGYAPEEELRRKFWEYAMLGLYLEEAGALRDDAEVLSIAAGHEEPLYWLANRVGRVVATDIYGQGGFAEGGAMEADAVMLNDPGRFAPYPYRADHLEVRSMDALNVDYPDNSFDVVFSLSSIEHFGQPEDIRRAAAEMARVVKPGGHLVIVTEILVKAHPLDWPPLQVAIKTLSGGRRLERATMKKRMMDAFRPRELQRDVIAPTGLEPVQPLDLTLSRSTYDNLISWIGDDMVPASGTEYPHILLKGHGSPWTSAFLAFHKPA